MGECCITGESIALDLLKHVYARSFSPFSQCEESFTLRVEFLEESHSSVLLLSTMIHLFWDEGHSQEKKMRVNDSNTGVFIRENARHWFLEQPACKWLKTKKSPLTKSSSNPLRCYVVRNPKVKKIIEINLTNKVWRLIFRYWSDVGCCNDAVLKHTPPPPGESSLIIFLRVNIYSNMTSEALAAWSNTIPKFTLRESKCGLFCSLWNNAWNSL